MINSDSDGDEDYAPPANEFNINDNGETSENNASGIDNDDNDDNGYLHYESEFRYRTVRSNFTLPNRTN